jgi:organic hydroperoxide reductase OsmC/OhrA
MTARTHHYSVEVEWTGNQGTGTSKYDAYTRDHVYRAEGHAEIPGSADPHFRGDPGRWNPEELLLAALSSCHKLSYLHLCAVNHVVVTGYVDRAEAWMDEEAGSGRFTRAVLHPEVTISADSDPARARELHHQAHHNCFVANSVNFPVDAEPVIRVEGG